MIVGDRLSVLLIEDDEDDYLLTRELLEEIAGNRLDLEWVSSYSAAHGRIANDEFDVCLVDFRLGEGTGLDLLREAVALGWRTPIILLTGQNDRETDLAAMHSGAADYLVKSEITARMLERSIRYARERQRLLDQIRDISLTDELTGLFNRRGFLTLGEQQLKLARRSRHPLLLLYMDVDGLKQVNDRFGHKAGDQMIVDTADLLRATFRRTDVIARLGGDEFVVLATDAEPEVARIITDRLRSNLDLWNATHERPQPLRFSMGELVCEPARPHTLEEFLAEADARMYVRKQARRAGAGATAGA